MKYKLAIFDLDGTLMDTSSGILMAVKDTIKEYDMPELGEEQIKTFIGPPIQWSFEAQFGISKEQAQRMADTFRTLYSTQHLLSAVPYPGIYDLLKALNERGITSAIATYKREDYALRLLKHYHFDDYTIIMFGGDDDGTLKKRDIILKCINTAGVRNLKEVVMVGDTLHDAVGAGELGVDFIGVSYGFGFHGEDAAGIESIAETTEDILRFV